MNRRKLVDVEMEQTGEAPKSPSYAARQANANTANQRLRNPATGRSWFETPSAEYQAWDDRKQNKGLEVRRKQGDQDIDLNIRKTKEWQPLANNEAIRALGMELKTRFPYAQYENETLASREIMSNALQAVPAFLNRSTAARLSPVSMSL